MAKSDPEGKGETKGFLSVPVLVVVGAIVVGLGAGAAVIATNSGSKHGGATLTSASGHSHHHKTKADKPAPAAPLTVTSIRPSDKAENAGWKQAVTVTYSTALSSATPLPKITPAVKGSWSRVGTNTLRFKPVQQYVPWTKEKVTVPAGSESSRGQTLGQAVISTFTVKGASTLRLQELLAELGYLPLSFTPSGAAASKPVSGVTTGATPAFTSQPSPPSATATTVVSAPSPAPTTDFEASVPADVILRPVDGTFAWRFDNIPTQLASQWSTGQPNEITTGAVMAFESANNMDDDGIAGPEVWKALLKAVADRDINTAPYDYVYVSEASPEYVTVWRDGVNVFETLANTGIAQAPTQQGTWPVYARYTTTTMTGTNPDGTHYSDPGIPWVSYFHGGDALHGYIRASYGFPQSLGCVEMPYSSAGTVFPYTPIGTLVTVF